MAEARTSAAVEGGAHERAALLATKLSVPRTRPDRLVRSRLIEALNAEMGRELILVCAPAGFGKTTLLAEWARGAKRPVAWLSLDPEDNDPARFWRYVVSAIERVCRGLEDDLLPILTPPSVLSSEGVVTALVNALHNRPGELALVLDDYHVIESRAVHDGVTFLLSHPPPQLHVIIASRSDPLLPLARLRVRGQLAELRAADLRFTPDESAAFLQEVERLELSPETLAALETRTEGWAAGLQLAALSLRERPGAEAFLDAFTGSHRYVVDYLSEEVLERQPDRVRTFLLESSILERLSGPLCDAVTGHADGQNMLEALERANLFLVPLDDERRWYRFHHLFAELLRVRLRRAESSRVPDLHRRAAGWCEQHGLVDEAIRHALASGDMGWAMPLVEQHVGETLRRGESLTLERWLAALPEDVVQSRPRLCLAQALMAWHRYRLDTVEQLLQCCDRASTGGPIAPGIEVLTEGGTVAEAPAAVALLRAELAGAQGNAEAMAGYARSALARMAEQERGPRVWARYLLAYADWVRGRVAEAEPAFARILTEGRSTPDAYPLMASCFMLGRVQRMRGELSAAHRTFQEGLRFATEGRRFSAYHAAEAHVGIAQVLYERNQLDDALRHVHAGIALYRQVVEVDLQALGLVVLAWLRQAEGDAVGALEAVDEACRIQPRADVVTLRSAGPSERARLLLAQGRVGDAERWTEERGLGVEDEISFPHERDYLVLARVLLARPEPARALPLLERLEVLAETQGRRASLIQTRALRSLALQAAGDHAGALALLVEALALACPEGFVRIFADEGPPMAALLRSLIGSRQRDRHAAVSHAVQVHINRVARSFGPARGRPGETVPAVSALIEPLTDRELEVLRLLAAGWRNREIARELVVTLDTVKKHGSHLFAKLGATNRTEAVARARELGLIP